MTASADKVRQDIHGAMRSLVRNPIASVVAALSLAAGIGATTATLTIRNIVFRNPPPLYQQPAQLSKIQTARLDRPIMPDGGYVPGMLYAAWRDGLRLPFAAATLARGLRDVRTADRIESVPVRAVTPEFFQVLGITPAVGRFFDASTRRAGSPPAVLSHRLWERLFDSQPDVVGKEIWIENRPYSVVGVTPARFWFSEMRSPIWTLLDDQALAAEESLVVVVRRPRGMTPAMLAAQLQNGLTEYANRLPAAERQRHLKISRLEGTPMADQMSVVLPYVLGASVLLTLLIACANVAILMIAQWTAREHEIAIRASLGASRGRIVRALLTESLLVAIAGGTLGAGFTFALQTLLIKRSGGGRFFDFSIDPVVFAQAAVITLATGILVGIAPALTETRRLHTNPLNAIGGSERVRQRWRHGLVVLEITVTMALLVETGAMLDAYQRAMASSLGFVARPLMSARVENPGGVPTSLVLDVLRRLPGVASAAASTSVPYTAAGPAERVALDAGGSNAVAAERAAVSPGFFSALDVPIKAGRAFTAQDSAATRGTIVNDTLARQLFKGRSAIGSQVWVGQTPYDVIGVVADYANDPFESRNRAPKMFMPLPTESKDVTRQVFLIRASGDPAPLVQTVRREVRDAASGNVVTSAFTFDQIVTVIGQEMLVGTAPLVPLIAIGMLLTTAGIYGVLAFAIARRSRELAVRIAIGASARDLIRLVSAHSFRLVAIGTLLGIAVMFGLQQIVRAGGAAGSPFDPTFRAFAIPVLMVAAIAALATWIPSRRALRINPAILLRTP
jgi:putative ABC transport system permease protein